MWSCYLLHLQPSKGSNTYIGATVDIERRLRQHNKEITGGAKYTTSRKKEDNEWKLIAFVGEFPEERDALQFEWMWKFLSRKIRRGNRILASLESLDFLIERGYSTKNSLSFNSYDKPLTVYEIKEK